MAQPVQQDWQMDFTQMPVSQGYKYLLVMIDTFTGWIEGLPTQTEKPEVVVKKTAPRNHSKVWSAYHASLFITNSQSSLRLTSIESVSLSELWEFTQTHVHRVSDAIQPSHPLSSPSPLAPNPSWHQTLFQ